MDSAEPADRADLRVVVEQTAPLRLEVDANTRAAEEAVVRAADRNADLVVFPELALTGYDLGRWARELAIDSGAGPPLALPASGPAVALGFVERSADGRIYNAAGAWRGDRLLHRHRKRFLPTYGMFDEGRLFAAGEQGPEPFELRPGWPAALLVCEELWHPAFPYLAALAGAAVILVLAAGPGRGMDPSRSGAWASQDAWRLLASATALTHGVYVVLANRAGVEGPTTFAGESLVVGPDGHVLERGSSGTTDRLEVVLQRGAIERARAGFDHRRDEDPRLVIAEMERILGGRRRT